ncbi:MAG: tyrosine-type recombinase/integrase [Alphaproteobacteria bacterium GM202ARS2]|nr:tyrosine-type recombinase/integrase [Alphaproteobacteria bacterium GM202ARS2]
MDALTPAPRDSQSLTAPDLLVVPAIVSESGAGAARRFIEFFTVTIRNPNTRSAYGRAVRDFCDWCQTTGLDRLGRIEPVHVGAYVELLTRKRTPATVKQHLAALRMLFDWLVAGQILKINPAAAVKGPKHVVRSGKTPVLAPEEAKALLESIDVGTVIGLRDRALIGLMIFSFARIGAALAMNAEDLFHQQRRLWLRLHEKGGKHHVMPCHHALEAYLLDYIETVDPVAEPKRPLFRAAIRGTKALGPNRLTRARAFEMVRRRARQAGIPTLICNHSFRATGITAYLRNDGQLDRAAQMAAHASTRTTQLYDRRRDEVLLDEVERIRL